MRTTRTIKVLALSALAVSICWVGSCFDQDRWVRAEPQATIAITQPDGVDDVLGNGDDFATTVLGDPWDMSQPSDILALHGLPGATITGGELRFTLQDSFANVRVLFPGLEGRMDVGKIGMNYPIEADHYRWLSFRMYQPQGSVQIKWFYDRFASPNRAFASSRLFSVTPGWHTYVFDLETIEIGNTSGGATGWDGQVRELDIVPSASPGTQVRIDWVRLTADNPLSNNLDVEWGELSPTDSYVDFYLDSDSTGCDGPLIHTEWPAATSGSFTWQEPATGIASPANVAPGEYYVCARDHWDGSFVGRSPGQLTVNQAPIVHFTQPSFTSGEDYATSAGNPWDMSDAADVDKVSNGSYTVDSGILAVTVPADKTDVQVHQNVPMDISSDDYYYLTYRLWFDYPYDWSDVGQQTRVFWGRGLNTEAMSDLIYVYPGWQTYSLDLRTIGLVQGLPWATADWTRFRIDPIANITGETVTFYLDEIWLTGGEKADTFANIKWHLADPDSSATTMTLYYDDDPRDLDGTYIVTLALTDGEQTGPAAPVAGSAYSLGATAELTRTIFLPLVVRSHVPPCSGTCYTWHTGDVPSGEYYLYACIDDGYNELCRYSEIPLFVTHP